MLWFPNITDVPKLGCFGLELKRPIRAGSTGEAGVPMGFAVRWELQLAGVGVRPSRLCRGAGTRSYRRCAAVAAPAWCSGRRTETRHHWVLYL